MFQRNNKKRSCLFFIIFFVLIVTIFKENHFRLASNRYLEKYFIENKKNNQRTKANTKILLNLEIVTILFFVIIIVFLLFCIFFIFKNKKDTLTNFYSHLASDDRSRFYNRLAKICKFDDFHLEKMIGFNDYDRYLRGMATVTNCLEYFKGQREDEDKKLYYFYYQKREDEKEDIKDVKNGEDLESFRFRQAEVTLEGYKDIKNIFNEKIFADDEETDKIMDEQKDTDYHDFTRIETKIDEIENFNFVDKIFAKIKSYHRNSVTNRDDLDTITKILSGIRKMIFFNFFLNSNERRKDDISFFQARYAKCNKENSKNDVISYYENFLQKIDNDIKLIDSLNYTYCVYEYRTVYDENHTKHLEKANDFFCQLFNKINIQVTDVDKKGSSYLPYGTFIVNLLGLYQCVSFSPLNQLYPSYMSNEKENFSDDIKETKKFFGHLVYTILYNYLLFLKKLIVLESLDFFEKPKDDFEKNFPPQLPEDLKNINAEREIEKKINNYLRINE